ncbi:hypothetical protein ACGFIJ_05270 [Microbispora bryophytorum]|uniref:hypothetical protein n=1 Tax=Microbispora bryophytorum TaxID=1460882 RepID=UPI00371FF880
MSGLASPDASPWWGERLRWTLSDASVIARTNLTHRVRNPAAVLNLTPIPGPPSTPSRWRSAGRC